MTDKEKQSKPTISMQVVKWRDGSHGVTLLVTGLQSEEEANAALAHMEKLFCGQEIGGVQ